MNFTRTGTVLTAAVASMALLLAGCSQSNGSTSGSSASGSSGAASASSSSSASGLSASGSSGAASASSSSSASGSSASSAPVTSGSSAADSSTSSGDAAARPAQFKGAPVKVSLVRQSGQGDYFQQWGNGAVAQAKAANIDLTVYDARSSNSQEAAMMSQAIATKPAAIIIDHGFEDTMQPLVTKAVKDGIKVITYDLELNNASGVVQTAQSDKQMAQLVLGQMAKEIPDGSQVGYVNVAGYAALDIRNKVWQKFVPEHHWKVEFKTGKVTDSTVTDNIPLVNAALAQHPKVQAIFAPYDALATGTTQAVLERGLEKQVKVYGMDISNADLQLMLKANSPWVATAATDPASVAAVVVRVAALDIAGQLKKPTGIIELPAELLTQNFLRSHAVQNMDDLVEKMPVLKNSNLYVAKWLPAVFK